MAYNEALADRIIESLVHLDDVVEKKMFGGVCYMVNGKMCMGVIKDELFCRIDPAMEETVYEMRGCRPMDFAKRPMKGFIYVSEEGMKTKKAFEYWVELALGYNAVVEVGKKKKNVRG